MKKLLTTILSLAAVTSFAGDYGKAVIDCKQPVIQPCYLEGELQVDLFGSGNFVGSDEFYGGGAGINYFITQYIGVGANWNVIDLDGALAHSSDTELHDVSVDLILRTPIFGPESCTAVYGIIGGGVIANGTTLGTWNVGVGLEHRFVDGIGIFVEGRQKFIEPADVDYTSVRVGARLVF